MHELEQHRLAKHRLAILRHAEEVSGSVAATCRYYGISRTRFYRWQQRYAEQGLAGLQDRSKRGCPLVCVSGRGGWSSQVSGSRPGKKSSIWLRASRQCHVALEVLPKRLLLLRLRTPR
jgi:transposase-like protein